MTTHRGGGDNLQEDAKKKEEQTTDNEQEDDEDYNLSSDSDSEYVGEGASKKASKPGTKFRPFTNGLNLDTVTQNFHFIVEQKKGERICQLDSIARFLGHYLPMVRQAQVSIL
jgi:cobalamin biosynthesis protein CobT